MFHYVRHIKQLNNNPQVYLIGSLVPETVLKSYESGCIMQNWNKA